MAETENNSVITMDTLRPLLQRIKTECAENAGSNVKYATEAEVTEMLNEVFGSTTGPA